MKRVNDNMASHKIVVIGDVNGRLAEVFEKLTTLHAKQSFAFAIIAGNLFSDPETQTDADLEQITQLLNGKIEIPLPTYFTLGRHSLPPSIVERLEANSGEVCPNLSVLDRKVALKTSEGFRIIAVGGKHIDGKDEPEGPYSATFKDNDVDSLAKGDTDADLLITNDWPANIRDGSKRDYAGETPRGAQSLSELCNAVKPRYYFTASEAFLEREPFFHNGPTPRPITRFISLAPFGNPNKQKWIYAFSLEPSNQPPLTLPPECTASPFTSRKRKHDSNNSEQPNFRYSTNGNDSHSSRRGGKRQRHQPPPTPQECFFCLSNPNCETHMIASIGDEAYLTVAKGPLTTSSTFPTLGFPAHILLIPHEHAPTLSSISDSSTRERVEAELQKYRGALHSMLASKNKTAESSEAAAPESDDKSLGAVTWEISRGAGVHLHWQFLPVPVSLISRGLVEAAFEVEAENLSYPSVVKDPLPSDPVMEGDFFRVQIWSPAGSDTADAGSSKTLVLPLDAGAFRFDLQFGRRVLAKLLGLEKRTHWRDCAQSTQEEEADNETFKKAFEEWDFSA